MKKIILIMLFVYGTAYAETAAFLPANPYMDLYNKVSELEKKYKDAKEKEQSKANKLLGGLTMAATGIGGMELARGLTEQEADKEAEANMTAYIETMRCTYAKDKSVKAGPEEIELPGGNNQDIMKYRAEYVALAQSLKERKEALGLKPGIESEEILDKTQMGLYDQENVGITGGNYESLYRAQMLGSEADKKKIAENAEASKRRVIAGAVVGGVGVVGGAIGDSLINGKLGELIKDKKDKKQKIKDSDDVIEQLTKGLKQAGYKNVDKIDWSNLDLSGLKGKISELDFTKLKPQNSNNDATKVFNTTNSTSFTSSLNTVFNIK